MAAPNSTIEYPTVPPGEEDPRKRINVMIDIFNASIPPPGSGGGVDRGFSYHEIWTAFHLVENSKIDHGKQISRPLTWAERSLQLDGSSQMIKVPMERNRYRELDVAYVEDGKTYIVEAKNKSTTDHAQMEPNLRLAQRLRGAITYVLPQKEGQERALRRKYRELLQNSVFRRPRYIPPLEVIQIPGSVKDLELFSAYPRQLLSLATFTSKKAMERSNRMEVGGEFQGYENDTPLIYQGSQGRDDPNFVAAWSYKPEWYWNGSDWKKAQQ